MDTPAPPHSPIPAFDPVPRLQNRRDGWAPAVQQAFIEFLADTGSVEEACRLVGRSPASAYRLRRHPDGAGFAAAWQAAVDCGLQRIEDYAMDRAINGVEVPYYAYGNEIATRRVINDNLAMFMLRNRLPQKYCGGEGARGMSALDNRELARLKAQWRREWEREAGARQLEQEKVTIQSINQKIDQMAEKSRRHESPRVRAAREAYEDAMEQDREENYSPYRDPAHELYIPGKFPTPPENQGAGGEANEAAGDDGADDVLYYNGPLALPDPRNASAPDKEPPVPRVRTLRDESWR